MGKRLESAKKWLGFAPSSRTNPEAAPAETPDWVGQAVVDFRQRIAEDPEFMRSFVGGALSELDHYDNGYVEASRKQLYGKDWTDLPDEIHGLVGEGASKILDILTAPPETIINGKTLPPHESAASEYYETIGRLILTAYSIGCDECPPALRIPGVYGHYMSGIGTLVIWERIRGLESTLDEFVAQQNTEKDTGTIDG